MAATIISNVAPFGAMTNQTVADLHTVAEAITRLKEAIATASSGYTGTPGTEFEGDGTNFGVVAGATPGDAGQAYAYAVNVLADAWATFWTAAEAPLSQLDNGVRSP